MMLFSRPVSTATLFCLAALFLSATTSAVTALPRGGPAVRIVGRGRKMKHEDDTRRSKDDDAITAGRDGDVFAAAENTVTVVENTDFVDALAPTATPADPTTVVASGAISVAFYPTKAPKSTKAPKPAPVVYTAPAPVDEPGRSGPSPGTSGSAYDVTSSNGNLVVNGNVIPGAGGTSNGSTGSGNSGNTDNLNGWVVENNNGGNNNAQISTETSNLATTYDDKCAAAEAGQEFRTRSAVPVYYEYELVTSSTRNVLQVVDTVDKAIQHFLAVWLVDCDNGSILDAAAETAASTATNNGQRALMVQSKVLPQQMLSQFSRDLQEALSPIVGTGVGDYDTVILNAEGGGPAACESLIALEAQGQVCYKVVGSNVIFINEEIKVTPNDIRTLAMETLNSGLNYAATDFTQLDPDIFGLFLVQGYDEAPETILSENFEANKRPWATTEQEKPASSSTNKEEGRSGGAKFGIAFVTLFFITLFVLLCVYLYKNRVQVFGDVDWENCCCCLCFGCGTDKQFKPKNQNKHASMDDITVPSTKYEPSRGQQDVHDDRGVQESEDPSIRDFNNESPESVKTRPLSPDPESPREYTPEQRSSRDKEVPSYFDESNIYTPRSDYSGGGPRSVASNADISEMLQSSSPESRMHLNLSEDVIRGSNRKSTPKSSPTSRSFAIQDTVEL